LAQKLLLAVRWGSGDLIEEQFQQQDGTAFFSYLIPPFSLPQLLPYEYYPPLSPFLSLYATLILKSVIRYRNNSARKTGCPKPGVTAGIGPEQVRKLGRSEKFSLLFSSPRLASPFFLYPHIHSLPYLPP
jgi:hypothetical protein